VRQKFRASDRGVTMSGQLFEPLVALQEVVSNPEQVTFRLLRQWNARADTGVNEEEVSAGEAQSQIVQEFRMLGRHRTDQVAQYRRRIVSREIRRCKPIGHQCPDAADVEPILE